MASNNDNSKSTLQETTVGVACWMTCSVGMLVFNKLAITAFPFECSLVALQMAATVAVVSIFGWSSLHIGSARDVMRWCIDVPFFAGMLLTSILALKHAPMSLVITFRALSPLVTLGIEQFYPHPLAISFKMLAAIAVMLCGCGLYTTGLETSESSGIFWVAANNFFAIGDRLLQRLMLAKDQSPVDISKTGVMLINNSLGVIPLLVVVFFTHEYERAPGALASLDHWATGFVIASCIVGVAISYTGIWVLSLISATSFLVLVNANKFVIIFLEAYVMHTKTLTTLQIMGACITILGGVGYGKAREAVEAQVAEENKALLAKNEGTKSV
jgi:hypothetical protein